MSEQPQGELVLNALKNLFISIIKLWVLTIAWLIKLIGSLLLYIASTINKYAGK